MGSIPRIYNCTALQITMISCTIILSFMPSTPNETFPTAQIINRIKLKYHKIVLESAASVSIMHSPTRLLSNKINITFTFHIMDLNFRCGGLSTFLNAALS